MEGSDEVRVWGCHSPKTLHALEALGGYPALMLESKRTGVALAALAVAAAGVAGCGGDSEEGEGSVAEDQSALVAASLEPEIGPTPDSTLECSPGPAPEFAGTELYECDLAGSAYGDGTVEATLDTAASTLVWTASFKPEDGSLEVEGEARLLAELPAEEPE